MIKTKLFVGVYGVMECDEEINKFLFESDVQFVDVKFQSATDAEGDVWYSALLVYKEGQ